VPATPTLDVQAIQIPFGSIVVISGVDKVDRAVADQWVAEMQVAAEHSKFAVVLLPKGGGAQVLQGGEVMDALRATMADEVDAEVVDRAVKAAQNAVQPVLEQVQRHAAAIAEAAGETP
jgi:hypothetical protein